MRVFILPRLVNFLNFLLPASGWSSYAGSPNALAAKNGCDNVTASTEKIEDNCDAFPGLQDGGWADTVGEMVSMCLWAHGR